MLGMVSVAAGQITIDTVPVGNPGNAPDPEPSTLLAGLLVDIGEVVNAGAVDYAYRIGKYEVTAGQYTEFLNAVAATDNYGL